MTATIHGRHTRQALKAHRQPAKAPRGRLRALRSFFWAPGPRGSKQTAASSLLGAPVDVAEEAQEQQRGGERLPVEQDERLADTSDSIAAIAETTIPEFAGAADRGQMAEPWTSPWDRAEITEAPAPGRRPYTPEPSEEDAEPPAFLRALDQLRRPMGPDDLLDGPPVFTRLAPVKEGGFVAEVNLGEVPEGSYVVAGKSPYLRELAAALLAAAAALDLAEELDEAEPAEPAADAADAPAEDGTASVLAEVVNGPAEPVADDTAECVATEDETVPEPAAEVLADTGTETEMARQSEMAAVSGEGEKTL
jgi:hypothetical protein